MQGEIEDSGSSPSFNCYSSESLTSRSIAKVIREEQVARFHEIDDVADEDFEFGLVINDDFNPDFLVTDEVDLEIKSEDHEIDINIDISSSINNALGKLFVDDPEESSSCSSSEVDELENLPSGTYCVWRPKAAGESPPLITKCKKSSSTGSGSKRWRIRYLLRRSNSEGKEPVVVVSSKKADSLKHKRNSGEVWKKARTPVHEQFYVKRREENEAGKRRSFLPYRKDLLGLFGNVNGMGKMLPF